ncbi:MAG TPA: CidA/LrgA family protein [Myxococcota bacterium]|nr:CidA/LrgA family protein [Myxococcota bacterium]
MLFACLVLLSSQAVGELLARAAGLPIPGPVLGMLLLLVLLLMRPRLHGRVQQTAHTLLNTMSLFFVPAGVGILTVGGALREHAAAFAAVVVISTLLAGVVTAAVFTALRPGRQA